MINWSCRFTCDDRGPELIRLKRQSGVNRKLRLPPHNCSRIHMTGAGAIVLPGREAEMQQKILRSPNARPSWLGALAILMLALAACSTPEALAPHEPDVH